MSDSIFKKKSFDFAICVVNLYKLLCSKRNEFVLSKQLLRSGTSIDTIVWKSLNAQSKDDFVHKLAISQKNVTKPCIG